MFVYPLRLTAQAPGTPAPDALALPDAQVDDQPGLAPLVPAAPDAAVPGRYIVVLAPDRIAAAAEVRSKALAAHETLGATVLYLYSSALTGFTADLTPGALAALRRDPTVAFVQQDQRVAAAGDNRTPPWNLDRLDQRSLPLDGVYHAATTGAGVHAYLLDSGINPAHQEFAGRLAEGYDAVDGGTPDDCSGHGTQVAGILGGTTTGVAPGVTLHAVRVLDCHAKGTESALIAGLDWVAEHHVAPAVVNLSLSGSSSPALDRALRNAVAAGVTHVVAAGNSSKNACSQSPARVAQAITVGASSAADVLAWFSNTGPCLDLFAPGVDIRSATTGGSDRYATRSGTSMAAPHVAGAAALYLEGAPTAAPAEVAAALLAAATRGTVAGINGSSPNLLLYTGDAGDPAPPVTPAATPAATPAPRATPTPAPLAIAAVEPAAGYDHAPNEVTITGANFQLGIAGSLGGVALGAVKLDGPTQLRAVVPAGMAPGLYGLTLRNGGDPEPARLPAAYRVLHAGATLFLPTIHKGP